MAKAKKTSTDKPKTSAPRTARRTPARKPPAAERSGAAPAPLIDTSSAAQAAAAMIAHRNKLQKAPAEAESGLVDQLKQEMTRPASQALGGLAGPTAQQKRSNLPFQGGRQLGPIQKGGGYNRTGVPRRTAG